MSTKVKAIFTELESRLGSLTDHTMVKGRMVDPQSDELPSVTYRMHPKKGVQSDEGDGRSVGRKRRQTLHVVIAAHIEIQNVEESFFELEDAYDELKAVLFTEDTNLGELAYKDIFEDERHSFVPDGHDDVGMVAITLAIPIIEDR